MIKTAANYSEAAKMYLDAWGKRTDIGRRLLLLNFFLAGKEFPGWQLHKTIAGRMATPGRFNTYIWQKADSKEEELMKIEIAEVSSWRDAHETLLATLEGYELPWFEEAESTYAELGDIAFVRFGSIIPAAIFVRANLMARLHSVGRKDVSVLEPARLMDELFVSEPTAPEHKISPQIEAFSTEQTTVQTNEALQLDIQAADPLGRALWHKLTTDQGELWLQEDAPYFKSAVPGQREIKLYSFNENGGAAAASLKVRVE